jgi:predicted transcriptional regulator
MANILNEAHLVSGGLRKTRLMYRCNLSFRQLKTYLNLLVGKGFLRVIFLNGGNKEVEVYQITEEGVAFLGAYNNLVDRLGEKPLRP